MIAADIERARGELPDPNTTKEPSLRVVMTIEPALLSAVRENALPTEYRMAEIEFRRVQFTNGWRWLTIPEEATCLEEERRKCPTCGRWMR